MNKLKELLSKCKASVSITVNQHRDYYQSVRDYIEGQADDELIEHIGKDVYLKMQETNTIIEIHAYPDTPIGNYRIIHYDIDQCIEKMLACVDGG